MYTNEYDDDDLDSEEPLPQDLVDDSDELPEMQCPNCRRLICEDTQKCPYCGDWIIAVDPPTAKWHTRRWMLVAAVMLMLLAMWRFIIR
ncbi:MAG: hypothetical protein ACE5EQ_10675 [Phycisphaerae bacterium]